MNKLFLALLLACSISSCYRMPTDDDYCLVPCVNNPDITREKSSGSLAPNLGF